MRAYRYSIALSGTGTQLKLRTFILHPLILGCRGSPAALPGCIRTYPSSPSLGPHAPGVAGRPASPPP